MAWIKVESSVSRNRKFVKAGPAASWLWICGLAYCQEGLTDGFIPNEALDFLGVKHAHRLSQLLVLARLWDVVDGGWQVHDYLGHNKDAATVRALQHDRREAGANGGRASGEARRLKQTVEANVNQNPKDVEANHQAKSKQPSNPATATATATATEAATTTASATAANSRSRNGPGVGILKPNGVTAFEGPRVYVPWSHHLKFLRLRNTPTAEDELQAFYQRVSEEWTSGRHAEHSPGADMFAFWQARYDEEWPPTATAHSKLPKWAQK